MSSTLTKESNMLSYSELQSILADKAEYLLGHDCQTISKDRLHLPSSTFVDDIFGSSVHTTSMNWGDLIGSQCLINEALNF